MGKSVPCFVQSLGFWKWPQTVSSPIKQRSVQPSPLAEHCTSAPDRGLMRRAHTIVLIPSSPEYFSSISTLKGEENYRLSVSGKQSPSLDRNERCTDELKERSLEHGIAKACISNFLSEMSAAAPKPRVAPKYWIRHAEVTTQTRTDTLVMWDRTARWGLSCSEHSSTLYSMWWELPHCPGQPAPRLGPGSLV